MSEVSEQEAAAKDREALIDQLCDLYWGGAYSNAHQNEHKRRLFEPLADFMLATTQAQVAEAEIAERQYTWDLINAIRYERKSLDEAKHEALERLSSAQVEEEMRLAQLNPQKPKGDT